MNPHHPYRNLATILAETFGDGSGTDAEARLKELPDPGNDWARHPPPEFPTTWASHWGQDPFGLWCAFTIERSLSKMRWIPPGEFHMGSPEGESERFDEETPHKVILTQGFWLAETACSQALWQAVMGENPSRFTGDDLPVEQVSWNEVKRFCERLNARLPGLEARLPSEAEWEYACRAGTEAAFWWGNELNIALANYNGNHPYDKGPKGEYRQKTLAVKAFEPNPWGLYQMHGNVLEWCEDWYSDYPAREVIDPTGPESGVWRVFRGGSWSYDGGWLRAACRNRISPDYRDDYLGFRLALGPRPEAEPK